MSQPYAGLDVRQLPREHLPSRNLVSTLFELNDLKEDDDAEAPLRRLGTWLPDLGERVEPVKAAYAEWLATVNETLYPGDRARALVERLTGADHEEDSMAVTVLEEQLQRRIRRERRDAEAVGVRQGVQRGIEQGVQRALADTRRLLAGQVARKFGPGTADRTVELLAGIGDAEGLRRAGEWVIDCATAEELVQRLGNGKP